MGGFRIGRVPEDLIAADEERFTEYAVATVIQCSGLRLEENTVKGYCHWFAGRDYGWRESQGDHWTIGYDRSWLHALGQHLAGGYDERLRRFSLHMACKAGRRAGKPFYWTRYLAIDLDNRSDHPAGSLRERYWICRGVIGSVPVVIRSPRRGLHLFFPTVVPVSTLGFTHTLNAKPVLIAAVLEAEGLEIRPA
jgi:hypothetical protein